MNFIRKIRIIFGYLISLMPTNNLRIFLYRKIFKYHIFQSKIGWRTVIVVDSVYLSECQIESYNHFFGPISVNLKKGASIGTGNIFKCGYWSKKEQKNGVNYDRTFEMEENSRISSRHLFDVAGSIIIGENSHIAGANSQFWTHGASVTKRNIHIGKNCYIGSAVRFKPGASIGNGNIVGIGSVVTRNFNSENVMIGGNPATILKNNYYWKKEIT